MASMSYLTPIKICLIVSFADRGSLTGPSKGQIFHSLSKSKWIMMSMETLIELNV